MSKPLIKRVRFWDDSVWMVKYTTERKGFEYPDAKVFNTWAEALEFVQGLGK